MTKKNNKKKANLKEKDETPSAQVNDNEYTIENETKGEKENKLIEPEIDIIKEKMEAEPELLEQKEGAEKKLLEFFSKDDLVKQVKEFENEIKIKDKKIKELDAWRDKYINLQAEFENTHKRWEKNRKNLRTEYTASVLKNFLPLYDSFKKAIDNETKGNEVLTQFFNQFLGILKYQGAKPIEVKKNDLFDYNTHEALSSIEKDDVPENTILDIVQDGWKLGKGILRYSKVIISKKPKPPEPEPEPEPIPEEKPIEKGAFKEEKEEESKSNKDNENKLKADETKILNEKLDD